MPKVPAYNRSVNLVKGEPDKKKIKPTVIDRTKYQSVLDKPLDAGVDNLVTDNTESLVPAVLEPMGFSYHSGTIKGKDAVYKKGNNYYMYNEKPDGKGVSSYGLVNIGDLSEPKIQLPQDSIPKVSPQVIDPMKVEGFNGMKSPIVEQYSKGGKVKGYYNGGDTEYDSGMSTDASLSPSPNSTYASAISAANERNIKAQQAKAPKDNSKRNANIQTGANVAGKALGAYGTGYYAATPQENESEDIRAKGLAAVGQVGPIGGAIAGVAAIGDQIGKPIKERSERTDEQGNLVDPNAAARNAMIGSMFSPSKSFATRREMNKAGFKGNKVFGWGKEYKNYLEDKAKDTIEANQKAESDAIKEQVGLTNAMKVQNALAAREAGDTSFQETLITPELKKYAPLRMADGGVVSGKGGPKSDSINAKVEAGSFIVPAENAPIAKELAAKVLKKAPMRKANLNEGGGVEVKLSNNEYLFTPEEKSELMAKGVNLKALAPNAEETAALKCGGRVPKYAKGTTSSGVGGDVNSKYESLRAKTEADLKRDFPNSNIKVIYKGDERNATEQLKNYKSGASTSKVSLHQLGGARDFNIIVDGRVLGNSPKDLNIYKKYLWKNAEDNGLFHLKSGKGDFGDTDPYHIGLVEEKGDGTAFKRLVETYPEIKNTEAAKKTLKELSEIKSKNPKDTTYDVVLDAFKSSDKPDDKKLLTSNDFPPLNYGLTNGSTEPAKKAPSKQKNVVSKDVKQYVPSDFNYDNDYGLNKKNNSDQMTQDELDAASSAMDADLQAQAAINAAKGGSGKAKSAIGQKAIEQVDVLQPKGAIQLPQRDIANQPLYGNKTPEQMMAANTAKMDANQTAADTTLGDKPQGKSFDWQGLADNAIGYGLPIIQGAIGFNKLKELGKRPKDKLDQDYLNAIATTSGDVATARQQAKFGFTGEEKAALAQENAALTNAGRFAARNLAGGSGANMLGAERSVINDAFGRKLQSRISDNALKMQKQEQAMARQQDLNNMVQTKSEMNRRLFNDTLQAWNTDQAGAGQLVGAALSNALDTNRYNKFKKQYEQSQTQNQF